MKNRKLAIIASITLAIIIAGAAGVYYSTLATNDKSPGEGPSESSTQAMENLRLGDYTN